MAASLETQQRPVMPVIFFFACQRNANIKSSTETHRNSSSRNPLGSPAISSSPLLLLTLPRRKRNVARCYGSGKRARSCERPRKRNGNYSVWFFTFDGFRSSFRRTRSPNVRVPRVAPRKTMEWTSEVGERARANNTESHTIRSIRTGRMRAATRRGAARCARTIHGGRDSRSRGSPFVCVGVGAGDNGPSADFPSPRRADPRRHGNRERDGNGRARLSSGAYGNQPARRSSKCHW